MKYTYPAVFHTAKEGGYWIQFPDLNGCLSQGEDINECMFMAEDAASIWLCDREDRKLEPIVPSIGYKSDNPEDIVTLIQVDTAAYRIKESNRAVKKTLTIPNWLNEQALKAHINFSSVLQEGLKKQLGIV